MSFVEDIATKRDGGRLNRAAIARFVRGATDGGLPSEQLAAMLMAICIRGMDDGETSDLVAEMLDSGAAWRLAESVPGVVDKHSTGGVGDTVSLVLAPLLAGLGVPVAMMAGRGLGHSQGTLDKLAAIPGFDCERSRSETIELVERCGAAIVAQTAEIAPADRTLYALRDVTGTVPSLPLIVGSIMSKKLALGAGALILDVKAGAGAFMKTTTDAVRLGRSLRAAARASGVACEALVTDMGEPLGRALGTACEVRAALEVLAGGGDVRLRELSLRLSEEAAVLVGRDRDEARHQLEGVLADGRALAAWEAIVRAHGGDPDPDRLALPVRTAEVAAAKAGTVTAVDGEALGWIAVDLGAGRRTRDEELAHGSGLVVRVRIGDRIEAGQPLADVLVGERVVDLEAIAARVRAAFTLGDEPVEPRPLVLGTVDDLAASD